MKNLLLHVCCGPCSEWPVQALREEGFTLEAYYYNPNIQPQAEWDKRLAAMREAARLHDLPLHVEGQSEEGRWRRMSSLSKEEHCHYCYRRRLGQAAKFARERGFAYLASSLQVSPYQDQELIARCGEEACRAQGLTFVSRPFMERFREGQEMARADGLYRQHYCGCIYSLGETRPRYMRRLLREFGLTEEDIPRRSSRLEAGQEAAEGQN